MNRSLPFVVVLASCLTETGNPELQARVTLAARTSAPDQVRVGAEVDGLAVHEAWVSIERLRFVQGEVCDVPGEVEIDAPPVVADVVPGEVVEFPARAGGYCRVRLRFEEAESVPGDAPPALADRTIVVTGQRADGVPFTIVTDEDFEIDLRVKDGGAPFTLEEGRDALILAFDVAAWLDGVPLDEATVTGGEILVSEASNPSLLAAFEANTQRVFDLFEDPDGDGRLDDDSAPVAGSAP